MDQKNVYISDLRSHTRMPGLTDASPFSWQEAGGYWQRRPPEIPPGREPEYLRLAAGLYAHCPPQIAENQPLALFTGAARGAEAYWFQSETNARFSPFTTPGYLASYLAHAFGCISFLHCSQTCSSGLQALVNAYAWLEAGFAQNCWVVASEYPLHPKTQQLLKATGILCSQAEAGPWPLNQNAGLGTVLAADAVGLLVSHTKPSKGLRLLGFGIGMEKAPSPTGIHPEGLALAQAMEKALAMAKLQPEITVGHLPGTAKGNAAERLAWQKQFGKHMPHLFGTKWFTGHSLGASGLVSLAWVWECLVEQKDWPLAPGKFEFNSGWKSALINAQGFGGQAISLVVEVI